MGYFPMCKFDDTTSRSFYSLDIDRRYQVESNATIVDGTYMKVTVPQVSDPTSAGRYEVAEGAEVVPLNALPSVALARDKYVIIGAGKSGMDAIGWLLGTGLDPDRICWIMPRDAWIINRDIYKDVKTLSSGTGILELVSAMHDADTIDDYYRISENRGVWLRIDTSQTPTRNKCATVSSEEIRQLRRVKNVLRLGRLKRVESQRLVFAKGDVVDLGQNNLFIDCSADGLQGREAIPVFREDGITLQAVSSCQQVFSAALIGYLAARKDLTDDAKNIMTVPIPHPDSPEDFVKGFGQTCKNYDAMNADTKVAAWLMSSRLNQQSHQPHWGASLMYLLKNFSSTTRRLMSYERPSQEKFMAFASQN